MSIGGSHEAKRPRIGRTLRIVMVFGALAALLVPMAYVFASFWSTTRQDETEIAAERAGVRYLEPLVGLIGVLAQAEAAAVDGTAVDVAQVRTAIGKVDAVDRRDGMTLGTRERWTRLRKEIDATTKKKLAGHEAYHAYSGLLTPALALVTRLGETSYLSGDARFGASVGLLRLPGVMADASHAVALLRPADPNGTPAGHGHNAKQPKDKGGNDHAGESPYAGPGRVAAVLDRISVSRETVQEGLRRNDGGIVDSAAGLDALDEFVAAIGALVETVKPAAAGEKVTMQRADAASERVRKATASLANQMLDAIDTRLAVGAEDVADRRFAISATVVIGLLLALVLLWLSLPGRSEAVEPDTSAPDDRYDESAGDGAPEPAPELIDARELLNSEELLHVGRAVRSTRGEPDDPH